jgi:Ca2+-binding RTX toxin-like protein
MPTIDGTQNNDALSGTSFADTISGLEGDDTIDAGSRISQSDSAYDIIVGGAGTDTWMMNCFGEVADLTLVFGSNPATLRSSTGTYVVDAYQMEKFEFRGGSGDDQVFGGQGTVYIDGGSGVDFWQADLTYTSGNIQYIHGHTVAIGPAGITGIHSLERVQLFTAAGNDRLVGGDYADTFSAGEGFDTLDAGSCAFQEDGHYDILDGQGGTDLWVVDVATELQAVTVVLGSNPGTLRSASGDYTVDAYGMEKLKFTGGRGDDQIYSAAGAVFVKGGQGVDFWQADYSSATFNLTFRLGFTDEMPLVGLNRIAEIERVAIATGFGADTLSGGAYADTLISGEGDDVLDAGGKTLQTDGSIDILSGQGGVDTWIADCRFETQGITLVFASNPATLRSTSGNFTVDAYGMDWVSVTGGAGQDRLYTGSGGKSVDGGGGADIWQADYNTATTNLRYFLGTTSAIASVGLQLITRVEQIDLTTGSGRDSVVGGNFADVIRTNAGNDQIDAGSRGSQGDSAIDVIDGGLGTDVWNIDCSSDRQGVSFEFRSVPATLRSVSGKFLADAYNMELFNFVGGRGADSLFTGARGGTIDGGGGIDFWSSNFTGVTRKIIYDVESTTKIDHVGLSELKNLERIDMTSGSGDDLISGGDYADNIATGAGDDRIDPRSRARQLDGSSDYADGGDGFDILVVDATDASSGVTIAAGGSPSFVVRSGDNSFAIDAWNMEGLEFTGSRFADSVTGGAAAELLPGNNGADTLIGGEGQDTLIGGMGADVLAGGGARDTFIFAAIAETPRANPDRIVDLAGTDLIDLSRIDANAHTLANDAFAFVAEFTGVAGQATLTYRRGVTTLAMDIDGDGKADGVILLDGRHEDHTNFLS